MWEGQATLRYWTPPWPPGPRQFAETSKKCSNLTISHQLPPISSPISRPTRQFSHAPHFLLTLSLSQSYPFPGASCTLRREWCDLGVSKWYVGTKVSTKSWSVNDVICSPCLVTVTCPRSHFGDEAHFEYYWISINYTSLWHEYEHGLQFEISLITPLGKGREEG